MRHNPDPLVIRRSGRTLVDRASLARILGRSPRTIRAHCTPVTHHHDGRALYDADQAEAILDDVPTRPPRPHLTPA